MLRSVLQMLSEEVENHAMQSMHRMLQRMHRLFLRMRRTLLHLYRICRACWRFAHLDGVDFGCPCFVNVPMNKTKSKENEESTNEYRGFDGIFITMIVSGAVVVLLSISIDN